ncbi:hypothetical protein A2715_00330 [Candidatus Woesebacteria bacterium RIFCSPHIGHO2_01_FULL_39_32]|uniref:Uncharacterized protein n=1 Tax=Candidatus Woesebacteria bacterium RIFCSPLOWO2_01_FULL_39_25 TaxID=1802521 RepID=A0A1F8BMR9_9BACT|nr:MAG: hypothetical protein A2124_01650 [Candidatus Woesebacteria bacterium GWB1_37_5]OGM24272.1 MAG: hypothetical protein A2715_00330 [Candidatus Woesebacteria bacterium RIFCSPHIGHO2_01_FULL_39_32]OGM35399.1 MAG: hypothetical protein A3F01_04685 [Candidatus Woesebacteria bacterium RIFCSPHIGHO2_12_FULL_38_11]OGM65343.1 MAG: hypothetical protein A2893_01285 [Candidatus Woesebacteria bacterium RIFCSPLOWO2_01_FULL_39_25]
MEVVKGLPPELLSFLRFSAIAGLLATTTLLMNFNHKAFSNFFGYRSKSLWWLFLVFSVLPLLLFLFVFNFLFGRLDLEKYGRLVLRVFGSRGLNEY